MLKLSMALDMDPHILNFYEDMDLMLDEVPRIISSVLKGTIKNPKEKLDGQNFTFRIDDNARVLFMGKGCPKWIRAKGGLTRDEMRHHYDDRPQVRDAFTGAFDAIQARIVAIDKSTIAALRDGVIACEVVTPINPNIVKYKGNTVCIIGFHEIGTKLNTYESMKQFIEFKNHLGIIDLSDGWNIIDVPNVVYKPKCDIDVMINDLTNEYKSLMLQSDVKTMGDILTLYVKRELRKHLYLPDKELTLAAKRLVYEDSRFIKNTEFPSKNAWDAFKAIDDERAAFIGIATLPIESFFRKFSAIAIDQYEFKLALVDDIQHIASLKSFVNDVRTAIKEKRVLASSKKVYARVIAACDRVDESLFTRNVEGIVFEHNGNLRKLTGAFTAINRLHGYFYFENAAQIIEPSKKLT